MPRGLIVTAYLTVHFYSLQFSHGWNGTFAPPSSFHFPSIFITARVLPLEMASLRFRQYLRSLLLHPRLGRTFFRRSFRVLFRRLSCYGGASKFKVAFAKRRLQLFMSFVNYSRRDQGLRTQRIHRWFSVVKRTLKCFLLLVNPTSFIITFNSSS